MEPIRTDRLLLRPFREEDAPQLNRISNQPEIPRWMPDWAMTPEQTLHYIRHFISCYPNANGNTAKVVLAVEREGKLIGMVGIANKKEVDNEIEMAWFVDEVHRGRGYITEAVQAAAHWAFSTLGMDYLIAIVEPENLPSLRVAEKCGFRMSGTRTLLNSGDTEEKEFRYFRLYREDVLGETAGQ